MAVPTGGGGDGVGLVAPKNGPGALKVAPATSEGWWRWYKELARGLQTQTGVWLGSRGAPEAAGAASPYSHFSHILLRQQRLQRRLRSSIC